MENPDRKRELNRIDRQNRPSSYYREAVKKFYDRIRQALGGKCVRCGIDDWRVLQIDHINGDGYLERKTGGGGRETRALTKAFKAGILHTKYQLLCANCHCIKTRENGEHKQRPQDQPELPLFR